jgi:tetrahydromethanopterin S-methyltransferase subunit C
MIGLVMIVFGLPSGCAVAGEASGVRAFISRARMPSVPSVAMMACNAGSMAAVAVPGVTVGPERAVAEERVPEPLAPSSSSEAS